MKYQFKSSHLKLAPIPKEVIDWYRRLGLELLESVNKALTPFERLAFLAITKDIWSAENGFLTPTLKIKGGLLDDTDFEHHIKAKVQGK